MRYFTVKEGVLGGDSNPFNCIIRRMEQVTDGPLSVCHL